MKPVPAKLMAEVGEGHGEVGVTLLLTSPPCEHIITGACKLNFSLQECE